MARPLRIEYQNACYHVMNRRNRRLPVFNTDEDYNSFLKKTCYLF